MAQPGGTFDAYDASSATLQDGSNREDVADIIYNIAPTETPFVSMAMRGTATNPRHEWLTDDLATAAANYQIEGDDYDTAETRAAPNRLHTYTQISAKPLTISGTQEVTGKYGRASEIGYQSAQQGFEIRRDMERQAVGFATSGDATNLGAGTVAGGSFPNKDGSSSAERVTANIWTWMNTNQDASGTATPPTVTAGQPADDDTWEPGAPRPLLESTLKNVIRDCWLEGGNPTYILCDGYNKQVISSFTGGATRMDRSEDQTVYAAVEVYVSDFGSHTVIPDRFLVQPEAAEGTGVAVLDMDYWSIDYLRSFQQSDLAKTGDSDRKLMLAEWALCSKNEKASGAILDLNQS